MSKSPVQDLMLLKRRKGNLITRLQSYIRGQKLAGLEPWNQVSDIIADLDICHDSELAACIKKWEEWEQKNPLKVGGKTEEQSWQDYNENVIHTRNAFIMRAYQYEIENGEKCPKAQGFLKQLKDIEASSKDPEEAMGKLAKIRTSIAKHYDKS